MNKPLLAVFCTLMGAGLTAQTIHYVSPTASSDGSSWETPANLQTALASATAGDEIWLTTGKYLTSTSGDRNASFVIPEGVQLYGGFTGKESNRDARSSAASKTVLSGAIGSRERRDNAYTVVKLEGNTEQSKLEGLTIRDGYANGAGAIGASSRAGGGVLISIEEHGATIKPIFKNCIFTANFARDGGAIYVDGRFGTAKPSFIDCTFSNNEANLDGGAIFNDGRQHGEASSVIEACLFTGNIANYGGALFNQASKGKSIPIVSNCEFKDNHAYVRGTTIYNVDHRGTSKPVINNCVFEYDGQDHNTDLARGK